MYIYMHIYIYMYIYREKVLKPPSLPINPKIKGIEQ